jgi:hypothetical protein
MGKPYSMDLRERVVVAIEGGMALPLSSNNLPRSRAPLSECLIRRVIRFDLRRFWNDHFWRIALKKSKIERRRKTRKGEFLADSATAILRSADTKLGGRFSEQRVVPHVAARKTHWQSLEFLVVTAKRLFQLSARSKRFVMIAS